MTMSSDRRKKLQRFACMCILLVFLLPAGVHAEGIDLIIGGDAAVPWQVDNTVPGDSGTANLSIKNGGECAGTLVIWVENVSSVDMGGDGFALEKYVLFTFCHERLESSVHLPARVSALPHSPSGEPSVCIPDIRPGESISLLCEWEFTETGGPQNDAQGDSLSFDLWFMLRDGLPSPPENGDDDPIVVPTVTPTVTPVILTPVVTIVPAHGEPGSASSVSPNSTMCESLNGSGIGSENPPVSNEQIPANSLWQLYLLLLVMGTVTLLGVAGRVSATEIITPELEVMGIAGLFLVIGGMYCAEIGCTQNIGIHHMLDVLTVGVLAGAAVLGHIGQNWMEDSSGWIFRLHLKLAVSGLVLLFVVIISYVLVF